MKQWLRRTTLSLLACLGIGWTSAQDEFRTFSSKDGGKTLTAKIVSVDMDYGTVTLLREDGKTMSTAITHFAKEDVDHIVGFARKQDGKLDLDPSLHADLAPAAARYKLSVESADTRLTADLTKARKAYLEVLAEADAEATRDGKLELVGDLETEKRIVESDGILHEKPVYRLPPAVNSARRVYLKDTTKFREGYQELRAELDRAHLATLGRLREKAKDQVLIDQIAEAKKNLVEKRAAGTVAKSGTKPAGGSFRLELEGTRWEHVEGKFQIWSFTNGKIIAGSHQYDYEVSGRDTIIAQIGNGRQTFTLDREGRVLFQNGKPNRKRIE